MMNCTGIYTVGKSSYLSKSLAAYQSSITGEQVVWDFHSSVWDTFIKTKKHLLGAVPVNDLYKQRAQQLRDTYDYLILNYSGGADSHNILMTFLNNNIKLDEIFVQRSKIDSKLYTPNIKIKGSENIFSEWDFVTKPSLDWVSQNFPEIKINVQDPFDTDISTIFNDDTFNLGGQHLGCFELYRQAMYSSSIDNLSGKSIASIYGIDKPLVSIKDNDFFMYFNDAAVSVASNCAQDKASLELFYYCAEMPELPFEQAYQLFKYFETNVGQRRLINADAVIDADYFLAFDDIAKRVLYSSTWDFNKFQAAKPEVLSLAGRTRDTYYLAHPELQNKLEVWKHYFDPWYSRLNIHAVATGKNRQRHYTTAWYHIGKFNA